MPTSHFYLNMFLGAICIAALMIMVLNHNSKEAKLAYALGSFILLGVAMTVYFVRDEDANDPMFRAIQAAKVPLHCSNGVKDADESGVDCGGSCDRYYRCTNVGVPAKHSVIDD